MPPRRPRKQPRSSFLPYVFLAVGLAAYSALAFYLRFVQDDAFITYRYVANFLAGHGLVYNIGERICGFTNFGWTIYLLSKHPEVEARVRTELQQTLAGRAPTYEEINKLSFMRQVFDEALRLYPPAWMFARILAQEDKLGGFTLPPKAVILVSPYVTHRLPAYWDAPAQFKPERFTAAQVNARPRYAYFPFGGGPRQCIGMPFALMEAPLILAMLMQAFTFHPLPGEEARTRPVGTLRPGPFRMTLTPLSTA